MIKRSNLLKNIKKTFEILKLYNNDFIFNIIDYIYKYINKDFYYTNFKYNNFL